MTLSAPAATQALLLELAACDLTLQRSRATLRELATTLQISALEERVDATKTARHDAFVEVEGIKAELVRAESDVDVVEKRIASDTQRLSQTSSAKDAQGLEHELESLRKRRADLEDIELAIMERLDAAEANLRDCEADVLNAENQLLSARDEESRQAESLSLEIRQQQSVRDGIVSQVPDDLYALYERQRERYGAGASHLRGGLSSASGVALTEADMQTIRNTPDDVVILCPDSNAILVRTQESGL